MKSKMGAGEGRGYLSVKWVMEKEGGTSKMGAREGKGDLRVKWVLEKEGGIEEKNVC